MAQMGGDRYCNDDMVDTIDQILREDDRDEFVSLMSCEDVVYPPQTWALVCAYGAVDCATAWLKGEFGHVVDPNLPLSSGFYPLHCAAEYLTYDLIELLLRHGVRTDVRNNAVNPRDALLPLNVTLETLCYHQYLMKWTPEESIFKLIIILCLPQMKVPLEANKLLAWNTKEVNEVFYHYAKEGSLIELAILMMVARKKVMAPIMLKSKHGLGLEGSMTVIQCVTKEIASLIDEEIILMGKGRSKKLARICKDKRAAMVSIGLLLEVFEKAGDTIEAYLQSERRNVPKEKVAKDVALMLEKEGFVLEDKDIDLSDIDCESSSIKLASEVLEKPIACRSQPWDFCIPSLSGCFPNEKMPIIGTFKERVRAISSFFPHGTDVLYPSNIAVFPRPNGGGDIHETMTAQVKERTKAIERRGPYFPSSRQFSFFASTLKRVIRRV